MKYGVIASTRPDSMWGGTVRWRQGRDGKPLAFDTEEQAREAARAFAGQNNNFNCYNAYSVRRLGKEENLCSTTPA